MELRVARLCMDCDEVHAEYRCPVCASDSFAYITRWIPADERRARRPGAPPPLPEEPLPAPDRRSHKGRWVAGGAFGLAALAAGRWLLKPKEDSSSE